MANFLVCSYFDNSLRDKRSLVVSKNEYTFICEANHEGRDCELSIKKLVLKSCKDTEIIVRISVVNAIFDVDWEVCWIHLECN